MKFGSLTGLRAGLATMALFGCLVFAAGASAHGGNFAAVNYCPPTSTGVVKCIQSVTKGGKVVLGKKTVPIVNPVTLQGGVGKSEFQENEEITEKFFAATNGVTLSATPQPVPGGLTGLVNCKEIRNIVERIACETVFENGLTGVNAAVELSRPASEIVVSEENLGGELPLTAVKLPVKLHLENPLLGKTCYIGSSSSPIWWNLTTGTTSPPAPNKPIKGTAGSLTLGEEGIGTFSGASLVDNAWAAPAATGCGGFLVEYILDPIIDSSIGVPSAAGKNTAALENTTIKLANASLVNKN